MIDDVRAAYAANQFQACFRLASHAMADQNAIDLVHFAGLALMQTHDFEQGLILLKAAVAFRPASIHYYINAASATEQLLMRDELAYFVEAGLRDFPDDPSLRRHKGNVALLHMNYQAATECYQGLLADDPDDFRTLVNLANTYRFQGMFAQSEQYFIRAAAIDPTCSTLLMGQSALYGELGRVHEAVALLDSVQDWDCIYMHAWWLLSLGDYQRGWELHRDRFYSAPCKHASPPPRPFERLDQIDGRDLAVLREGGFGDVFQFIRYLPMLAQRADNLLLHCFPSEMRLLRANLPHNITLRETDGTSFSIEDKYEYTAALLDLPWLYHTTIDTIPTPIPYLRVPAGIIDDHRLPATEKTRVGLVWAGGAATSLNERGYDVQRSIELHAFAAFADFTDIEFINLQFGARSNDLGLITTSVLTADSDWMDTAAIVAQLDLIISVDTAVVHLAGAMGKPTWLLSRFNPCWRWLRNRPDSPWYPGVVRVFGQSSFSDWATPISEVQGALQAWLKSAKIRQ